MSPMWAALFLKEHRKVEEQEATITRLKSDAAKEEATISQLESRHRFDNFLAPQCCVDFC
jgi:hypothetical protein